MSIQVLCFLSIFCSSSFITLVYAVKLDQYIQHATCDLNSNYTSDSRFSTNLEIALETLENNTAPTGFTATISPSNSSDSEPVTALALCRAPISPAECQACVDTALLGIRQYCPNQTSAQVWYDYCTLRYSSKNFINEKDSSRQYWIAERHFNPDNLPSDYNITLMNLMQNLSRLAGKSDKLYAMAKMELTGTSTTLYGYVDCTRDVDGGNCTRCLLTSLDIMGASRSGSVSTWYGTPTCNIQFNTVMRYKYWESAPDIGALLAGGNGTQPKVDPEARTSRKAARNRIIGGAIGGMGGVIFIVGLLCIVKWRIGRVSQFALLGVDEKVSSSFFDLDVLIAATNRFSDESMLGRGGFGTVYKGRMPDGQEIAVKKLAADSMQGKVEFENEARVLLKMQHRNLVKLLGCCARGNEKLLVYEYLPNKSLDKFLFEKSKSAILDWPKRLNIIMGVARGLLYLHQDSAIRTIHRDIKASNILLDQQMNPKISDFGLARLFDDLEVTHFTTYQIAGTRGYMAPEYAMRGFLSVKSDVFSFGVLMLEIVSGRKNFDQQFDEQQQELLSFAWILEQEGRLIELVDKTMGSYAGEEDAVIRCLKIAILCTQHCVQDRPTMSFAISMLTNPTITIPAVAGRPGYWPHTDGDIARRNHLNIFTTCVSISTSLTFLEHDQIDH